MKLHKHTGLLICIICLLMAAGGCSKKEMMTGADQAEEIVTDSNSDQKEEDKEEDIEEGVGSEAFGSNDSESEGLESEGIESEISQTESSENENGEAEESDESKEEEPTVTPTKKPEVTKVPEVTAKPTQAPKPTKKPEETKPTNTPKPTKAPEATKAPTATVSPTPEPTKAPKPTEVPAKEAASINDIHQAVKKAYGEHYMPVMAFDSLTISELYKVDASWYEEAAGEGPMMSAHVDVFLGFKAKSGYADQIKAALTTYRDYLINESMQYPMNVEKVQNATVYQNGDYVFFLMLGGYREDVEIADYNKLAIQTIDSVIAGK